MNNYNLTIALEVVEKNNPALLLFLHEQWAKFTVNTQSALRPGPDTIKETWKTLVSKVQCFIGIFTLRIKGDYLLIENSTYIPLNYYFLLYFNEISYNFIAAWEDSVISAQEAQDEGGQ